MPINHTRKTQLAALKSTYGVKHADAIALLDHPDEYQRAALCNVLANTPGVNTYKDAVAHLAEQDRAWAAAMQDEWDDLENCDCGYPLDEGRFHCCDCGAGHEYHCVC
ncbi:hypothetical protein [Kitasatospora sp. HPMI-4]|uniref:hypothetical protein n=1 Tax=Kitasatospora sp. HPMI-4 TaxID=3448443 RepID=UPI003F1942FB